MKQTTHHFWKKAQENGTLRNGRLLRSSSVMGNKKSKKARNKKACRGKVDY